MPSPLLKKEQGALLLKAALLTGLAADLAALMHSMQERHEQLTRRYERLERQTERLTNLDIPRSQRLLAEYERLGERHAQSEEELDELENLVLEPLLEARNVLLRLAS